MMTITMERESYRNLCACCEHSINILEKPETDDAAKAQQWAELRPELEKLFTVIEEPANSVSDAMANILDSNENDIDYLYTLAKECRIAVGEIDDTIIGETTVVRDEKVLAAIDEAIGAISDYDNAEEARAKIEAIFNDSMNGVEIPTEVPEPAEHFYHCHENGEKHECKGDCHCHEESSDREANAFEEFNNMVRTVVEGTGVLTCSGCVNTGGIDVKSATDDELITILNNLAPVYVSMNNSLSICTSPEMDERKDQLWEQVTTLFKSIFEHMPDYTVNGAVTKDTIIRTTFDLLIMVYNTIHVVQVELALRKYQAEHPVTEDSVNE
jgi:hypothetical protein